MKRGLDDGCLLSVFVYALAWRRGEVIDERAAAPDLAGAIVAQ